MQDEPLHDESIRISGNVGTTEDPYAIGYMCRSAFEYELGYTRCQIWNGIPQHRAECSCAIYGAVEVTIRFSRLIKGIAPPLSNCRDVPELLDLWNIAANHIHNAKLLVPIELLDPKELQALRNVDDILRGFKQTPREFDLQFALMRLNTLGHLNMCDEPFWREMLAAAEILGLVYDRKRFIYVLNKLAKV